MPDVSFSGLAAVAVVAFLAPLALGLAPRLRLPAVVLEIVAGTIIGPHGLGLVRSDLVIQILALLGLAFLLLLAGLEIEPSRFRGRFLRTSLGGLGISFALALAISYLLSGLGVVETPLIVAITLLATSLGLVIPVLKDAGESGTTFGQLTIAGSSMTDFAAVILLSLFFSREVASTPAKLILLGAFLLLAAALGVAVARVGHYMPLSRVLVRLQDTTAEIRVRGAVLLLLAVVVLAERFGLEVILGAFIAGAILKLVDRDVMMSHPHFRLKLEAIGFGFLVPVFFVSSGLNFDVGALAGSSSALLRVPVFLLALLLIRGLPAALYAPVVGVRKTVAAGLMQATSLPFIVAATQIGMALHLMSRTTGAGLVAAGLLSVLIFPLTALTILRGGRDEAVPEPNPSSDAPVESSSHSGRGRRQLEARPSDDAS